MKCPNCGAEIEIINIDPECCDGQYYEYFEGVCPDCEEKWEWEDIYDFSHTEGPRIINPNDHL